MNKIKALKISFMLFSMIAVILTVIGVATIMGWSPMLRGMYTFDSYYQYVSYISEVGQSYLELAIAMFFCALIAFIELKSHRSRNEITSSDTKAIKEISKNIYRKAV